MDEFILNQITLAGGVVWLMEKLKGAKALPWVSQATDKLNTAISVVVAALSAAGILVTANWTGFDQGIFGLTISGLTLPNIAAFIWKAAGSLVFQEGIYRVLKASRAGQAGRVPG